jgi:hypothetical protein
VSRFATKIIRLAAPAIALGVLVGGCSDIYYDRRDSIALSFGDAIATDKAVQTIDPWPPGSGNRRIAFNGQRMQAAIARYRNNRVVPPHSMTTTSAAQSEAQAPAAAAPTPIPPGQ